MPGNLPQANGARQGKICWGEIDKMPTGADDGAMKTPPVILEPRLYVGEWIKVLRLKQKVVAKKAGISAPYLNNICKRVRVNPSLDTLIAIAEAMDLKLQDLQRKPPASETLAEIQQSPPDLVERLRRRQTTG